MTRTHSRRWFILGALLLLGIGVVGYRRLRPHDVTVERVIRGRAVEAVYATGTVEPRERVIVKSRLSEHVEALLVHEGDPVTRGQLLARIDNPVRGYALTQGETQLERARQQAGNRSPTLTALEAQARALRAQLELARIELARNVKLATAGAIPQQELDASRYRVSQLDAQVQSAEAQLRATRVDLVATRDQLASQVKSLASEADEAAVVSPIGGIVLRRAVELGEVVTQNQALFEIADTSELLVELRVDEADIARIKDGPTGSAVALSFYAFPNRAFAGKVAEILPEPDRVRRAYTVKVRLDAPIPGLRVGMTAEANVIVQRKDDALLLPTEALDRSPGTPGDQAWFAVDGHAVRRPVTLGIRDLTSVEVIAGAAEGDLAIVDPGGRKLSDHARLTTTTRSADVP